MKTSLIMLCALIVGVLLYPVFGFCEEKPIPPIEKDPPVVIVFYQKGQPLPTEKPSPINFRDNNTPAMEESHLIVLAKLRKINSSVKKKGCKFIKILKTIRITSQSQSTANASRIRIDQNMLA